MSSSSSSSAFKSMSSKELRDKLMEFGYDIPVSVDKDFMIRKLEAAIKEKKKNPNSRKSIAAAAGGGNRQRDSESSDDQPHQYFATTSTTNTSSTARGNGKPSLLVSTNSSDNAGKFGSSSSTRRSTRGSIASPSVTTRPRVTPEPDPVPRSSGSTPQQMSRARKPQLKRPRPSQPADENSESDEMEMGDNDMHSNSDFKEKSRTLQSSLKNKGATNSRSRLSDNPLALPPTNKFGLLVSGRMMQDEFVPNDELDPKKFVIEVPDAQNADFLAVFLTGVQTFPPGSAGQIYLGWPNSQDEVSWHLLGHISNITPSAFFNITEIKKAMGSSSRSESHNVSFGSSYRQSSSTDSSTTMQIGISIEPLEYILSSISQKTQL